MVHARLCFVLSLVACDPFRWDLSDGADLDGPFATGSSHTWRYDVPGGASAWTAEVTPAKDSGITVETPVETRVEDGQLVVTARFVTPGRHFLTLRRGGGKAVERVRFDVFDVDGAELNWSDGPSWWQSDLGIPLQLVVGRDVQLTTGWSSAEGQRLTDPETFSVSLDGATTGLTAEVCPRWNPWRNTTEDGVCLRADAPVSTGTAELVVRVGEREALRLPVSAIEVDDVDAVVLESGYADPMGMGGPSYDVSAWVSVDDVQVTGALLAWTLDGAPIDPPAGLSGVPVDVLGAVDPEDTVHVLGACVQADDGMALAVCDDLAFVGELWTDPGEPRCATAPDAGLLAAAGVLGVLRRRRRRPPV